MLLLVYDFHTVHIDNQIGIKHNYDQRWSKVPVSHVCNQSHWLPHYHWPTPSYYKVRCCRRSIHVLHSSCSVYRWHHKRTFMCAAYKISDITGCQLIKHHIKKTKNISIEYPLIPWHGSDGISFIGQITQASDLQQWYNQFNTTDLFHNIYEMKHRGILASSHYFHTISNSYRLCLQNKNPI